MKVLVCVVGMLMTGAMSVHAGQEALGKTMDSQQLGYQSGSQRIVNAEVQDRYTPEMLSARKVRKYRRPVIFKPIQPENLTTIKKRKTFLLDSN